MIKKYLSFFTIFIFSAVAAAQTVVFSLKTDRAKQKVFLASSLTDWSEGLKPMLEVRPGLYKISIPVPWVPQLQYKFVVDGKWVVDPKNSDRVEDGVGGYNSVFNTGFVESDLLNSPGIPSWVVNEADLNGHHIALITPPFALNEKVPTIYFQDGGDYLNKTNIVNLLTNYFAKTGRVFVAVLVSPEDRMKEYGDYFKNSYDSYLAETLVSYIEKRVNTGGDSQRRLLIGPSMGGLATLRAGLTTNAFGYVASQSGSFWYIKDHLSEMVLNRINTPKIYLVYGVFEADSIIDSNSNLQSILSRENVKFEIRSTPTQHDWYWWRNQFEPIFDWYAKGQ